MRYLSVCSGIEAATVAWHPLGWKPVAFSEVEPFPCAVLKHHYPDVPNLGDMTKIDGPSFRDKVDVLVGGTPCQSFSVAGYRRSLEDPRGNLTLKFVELADEIEPAVVLWENVPGVLNTKDNAFGCLLGALSGEDGPVESPGKRWTNAGYVLGPKRAVAWRVLDAQYFGVAQRRRRVFLVGGPRDGADPRQILFESEGRRRDTAPSREAREDVAPTINARVKGGGGLGTDFDLDGGLLSCFWNGEQVTQTLDAVLHKGQTMPEKNRFPAVLVETKRNKHVGSLIHPLNFRHWASSQDSNPVLKNISLPLRGADVQGMAVLQFYRVRRLTPRECERLQGFPDDYTLIPYRNKPACDGPRYKAIGNSMAVPCMNWLGRRIEEALR